MIKTRVDLKIFGERLFQISDICIVKVYFFQTSIISTIPPNFGLIRPNFDQFSPINR
jgi:hypothetical protein